METLQVTEIKKVETLEALNRSEIDVQVATAKRYPRSIQESTQKIMDMATLDEDTAQECFYSLRRGSGNNSSIIEGPSVRLAEIVAASWGNLRVQAQIIANDGKFITARGICHDLETNTAISCEVQRRITDKYGKTFSEDMQVVTGNAAGAIAFRNAVFKVVPKAVINNAIKTIKNKAMGKAGDIDTIKQQMLQFFAKLGVSTEMVLSYLEIAKVDEINADMVSELRGVATALKDGLTTVKEAFIDPYNQKQKAKNATTETSATKSKVAAALERQNAAQATNGTIFND